MNEIPTDDDQAMENFRSLAYAAQLNGSATLIVPKELANQHTPETIEALTRTMLALVCAAPLHVSCISLPNDSVQITVTADYKISEQN